MDWLKMLEHYCAAIEQEYQELLFQAKLAGARFR